MLLYVAIYLPQPLLHFGQQNVSTLWFNLSNSNTNIFFRKVFCTYLKLSTLLGRLVQYFQKFPLNRCKYLKFPVLYNAIADIFKGTHLCSFRESLPIKYYNLSYLENKVVVTYSSYTSFNIVTLLSRICNENSKI